MSKSKKKRRKTPTPKVKKKNYKPLIVTLAVIVVAIGAIAAAVIFSGSSGKTDFIGKTLSASKAFDSSGDEAELADVYNVRYDAYKGTMTLNDDGTFSFWMTPGSKDDGVHGGKYSYDSDKEIINATFDDGEKIKFKVIRNSDGTMKHIEVPYQGYTVYMK